MEMNFINTFPDPDHNGVRPRACMCLSTINNYFVDTCIRSYCYEQFCMPFHLIEPPYRINHADVQHNYMYVEMRLAFLNIQDKFLYLKLTHLCQKYDFIANHGSFVV